MMFYSSPVLPMWGSLSLHNSNGRITHAASRVSLSFCDWKRNWYAASTKIATTIAVVFFSGSRNIDCLRKNEGKQAETKKYSKSEFFHTW